MTSPLVWGSLASATLGDLMIADFYVGAVAFVGALGDGDAMKVIYERFDGGFDTFSLGELQKCMWWRLVRPEDVLSIEALVSLAYDRDGPLASDSGPGRAKQLERRRQIILAEQAYTRERLGAAW